MKCKAYAKINLCLDVVGKREDGYHELDMIMMPLELHDEITIELAKEDVYSCNIEGLVMDETNTVVKSVELMRKTFGLKEHFHVHVEKNIPAEAGLAGGSADGAAVLRAIRKLCHIDITIEELAQLGKQVGADVPFCVLSQCAIVKGIGEKLEPFDFSYPMHVVLIKPNKGVSTGKAFGMLDFHKCEHPDSAKVKEVLCAHEFEKLQDVIANSLEYSAFQLVPEIKDIKEDLLDMGFMSVLMSGSGSTVFALSEDKQLAQKAVEKYKKKDGYFALITSFR